MEQEWIMIRATWVCTGEDGYIGHLLWTTDLRPVCPVCGAIWPVGAEAPWTETGVKNSEGLPIVAPSYGICFGCHTEFGNDDTLNWNLHKNLDEIWAELRRRWLYNE